MPTLAILDDLLPMQLKERPDDLAPVEVVWSGTDLDALRREGASLRPDVLALDLARLGDDPVSTARDLSEHCGAELVLLLYDFAPRELLREASRVARPVKVPVRLGALRAHMTSVIVRGILAAPSSPAPTRVPTLSVEPTERRYSRAQLGRLAEIQSTVDCECPNHLSELLIALSGFEDYALACKSKNEKDAEVHAMLYRSTVEARKRMEDALSLLLAHEKIVL